jgi:hypothetical protein
MSKKFLLVLPMLLLAGCMTTTFSRLTPEQQPRNQNNVYPVEVVFNSSQQSLRWDSIKPYVLVNGSQLPMRQVLGMQNRWEGLVPVPPTENSVTYRVVFDFTYNSFGTEPKPDSSCSPVYTLKIIDQ